MTVYTRRLTTNLHRVGCITYDVVQIFSNKVNKRGDEKRLNGEGYDGVRKKTAWSGEGGETM